MHHFNQSLKALHVKLLHRPYHFYLGGNYPSIECCLY